MNRQAKKISHAINSFMFVDVNFWYQSTVSSSNSPVNVLNFDFWHNRWPSGSGCCCMHKQRKYVAMQRCLSCVKSRVGHVLIHHATWTSDGWSCSWLIDSYNHHPSSDLTQLPSRCNHAAFDQLLPQRNSAQQTRIVNVPTVLDTSTGYYVTERWRVWCKPNW